MYQTMKHRPWAEWSLLLQLCNAVLEVGILKIPNNSFLETVHTDNDTILSYSEGFLHKKYTYR